MIAAVLFGLLLVTASCGELQDPANGTAAQSGVPGAELINATTEGGPEENSPQQQQGQPRRTTTLSALALAAAASPGETRSVSFGWDPSASEGILGYKVYLIAMSTAIEQIIDVGQATAVALPLKVGESYGVAVTAYNSSLESQALPYLHFHVVSSDQIYFPPTDAS